MSRRARIWNGMVSRLGGVIAVVSGLTADDGTTALTADDGATALTDGS